MKETFFIPSIFLNTVTVVNAEIFSFGLLHVIKLITEENKNNGLTIINPWKRIILMIS